MSTLDILAVGLLFINTFEDTYNNKIDNEAVVSLPVYSGGKLGKHVVRLLIFQLREPPFSAGNSICDVEFYSIIQAYEVEAPSEATMSSFRAGRVHGRCIAKPKCGR